MTKRGCCLWWVILVVMLLFVWAKISLPLEKLGTIEHVSRDGTVKSNPTAVFLMIGILSVLVVIVAVMLRRAEGKVIKAGDSADPIAPVTQTARSSCGTGLAMLAVLGVCGLLVWIASAMGGL